MGEKRREIKERAKKFAFANKWNIWKPTLVIMAISFAFGLLLGVLGLTPKMTYNVINGIPTFEYTSNPAYSFLTSLFAIATIPLSIGLLFYLVKLVNGKEVEIKDLFSKYKYILPLFITMLLVGIFTCLWSILLIIPGIIYAFKVALVPYLLATEGDENTKPMDVINKSKEKMQGHKWEYFVFNLSFIGWFLLCGITFGIAAIWVVPYVQTANIMYFESL